jgi:predicted HicB family RNase H-like nuclease
VESSGERAEVHQGAGEMTKAEIRRLAAQYPKLVEWSEADQVFIGRCPLLFGGGIHGKDEASVYAELCKVAEEWVIFLQKEGRSLPPAKLPGSYSGKFMVRVQPALHQRLALKAMSSGESLNSFVTRALTKI